MARFVFTAPSVNLCEAFEHQCTIIDVFRDGIKSIACCASLQSQFFLAQRPRQLEPALQWSRVLWFNNQSLR